MQLGHNLDSLAGRLITGVIHLPFCEFQPDFPWIKRIGNVISNCVDRDGTGLVDWWVGVFTKLMLAQLSWFILELKTLHLLSQVYFTATANFRYCGYTTAQKSINMYGETEIRKDMKVRFCVTGITLLNMHRFSTSFIGLWERIWWWRFPVQLPLCLPRRPFGPR